jgi:hypothetical protein
MCCEREHQTDSVGIVVTARKPYDVNIGLTEAYLVRNKTGALDGVDDENDVAYSLAAILSQVAVP